jgi:hypothetical protein
MKTVIFIFGTQSQSETMRSEKWFDPKRYQFIQSVEDFKEKFSINDIHKNTVFISLSSAVFTGILKYLLGRIWNSNFIEYFHKYRPPFLSFTELDLKEEKILIHDLFDEIFFDSPDRWNLLRKDQLISILSKPINIRRDLAIGIQVLKGIKKIRILRGDMEPIYISMENFTPNSLGLMPDFNEVEIMEFGHFIRFGEYEASLSGILYECDRDFRLKRKKERLQEETSFGACLRRYRIQKKINQTDFKKTSEKTIRRIEDGEKVKQLTKSKILKELEISEKELLSY